MKELSSYRQRAERDTVETSFRKLQFTSVLWTYFLLGMAIVNQSKEYGTQQEVTFYTPAERNERLLDG